MSVNARECCFEHMPCPFTPAPCSPHAKKKLYSCYLAHAQYCSQPRERGHKRMEGVLITVVLTMVQCNVDMPCQFVVALLPSMFLTYFMSVFGAKKKSVMVESQTYFTFVHMRTCFRF